MLAQNPAAGILDVQQVCRRGGKCRVNVKVATDTGTKIVVTAFHANRVGEDMRYFPSEREGGMSMLVGGGTYCLDLRVVIDERI